MNTIVVRPTLGRGCVTLQSALNELHVIGHDGLCVSIELRGPEDQPALRFARPLLEVRYGAW